MNKRQQPGHGTGTPDDTLSIAEEQGINLMNEGSLHAAIKEWYACSGDRFEVKVGNSIVDIVRDDVLIEIQTGSFSAIRQKLRRLVKSQPVRLVYPIASEKWIVYVPETYDEVISRRKSPKRGKVSDLFYELVRMPDMINEDNFTLEVLMISMEEIRCRDGKGSWRRNGVSIVDRKLVEVVEQIRFNSKEDFIALIPHTLRQPFTNKSLAQSLAISTKNAQKMTYCLKKMEAVKEVGKEGRAWLYEVNI